MGFHNDRYGDTAAGLYAIGYGAWGGAAFYPFRNMQVYCDSNQYDLNEAACWDPAAEQLTLNVENNTDKNVSGWERTLTVKKGEEVEVDQFWSCSVNVEGNVITLTPADYNRTIVAGGSVGDVGIILNILAIVISIYV